jgi:hypothetical protein
MLPQPLPQVADITIPQKFTEILIKLQRRRKSPESAPCLSHFVAPLVVVNAVWCYNVSRMKLVYIIGTRHEYQTGIFFQQARIEQFAQMLCQIIEMYKVAGVGEELCLPVLMEQEVEASIPYRVCQELGLAHKYCDPDKATKGKLGITNQPQREQFWLDQIKSFTEFPVLFICGMTHCDSFAGLLESSGFKPVIVYKNWPHR